MIGPLGFPAAIATATSQFVLVIVSSVGTATHILTGGFDHGHGLRRTACLSVGVIIGAQIGARASLAISAQMIQRLLAIAIVIVALRLAWVAFSYPLSYGMPPHEASRRLERLVARLAGAGASVSSRSPRDRARTAAER